mgnify:CR=1 FL=1
MGCCLLSTLRWIATLKLISGRPRNEGTHGFGHIDVEYVFLYCAVCETPYADVSLRSEWSRCVFKRFSKSKPKHQLDAFDLQTPLLQLSKHDFWTVSDACEGTQVFGATGSGKTSGSGQAIAKAMLRSGFGGLVLTAKPDECELWRRYAEETGRSASVVEFGSDDRFCFNFLDYELSRSKGVGSTENIVSLLTTVLSACEGGGDKGRDPFWDRALKQLLRNTVDLLRLSCQGLSVTGMAEVIGSAPHSRTDMEDESWRGSSLCWSLMEQARSRSLSESQLEDLKVTVRYWCEDFVNLATDTRSSVVATFTTMVDGLLRGRLRTLFCTKTTIVPEVTHQGVVLIINLPLKEHHELGRLVQIIWKYCWQRATEARNVNANPRPVFLWADEAQLFLTSSDQDFQATARSARAATVYLTQSISNYYSVMGGANPKATTDAFLGVLQTKIMHANGDAETNEWAERSIAKKWMPHTTASTQPGKRNPSDLLSGDDQVSTSTTEQLNSELLAREFTMMRKGGAANGYMVDAVIFQGGRVWGASNSNFVRASFAQ